MVQVIEMKRRFGALSAFLSETLRSFHVRPITMSCDEFRNRVEATVQGGDSASLVLFEIDRGTRARNIARILTHQVRSIDTTGWFDNDHLAALLPHTSVASAEAFAGRVTAALENSGQCAPDHEVRSLQSDTATASTNHSHLRKTEVTVSRLVRLGKRLLDVSGALFGLALLTPLFLMVAALIKCVSRGPVFFKQERVGCDGRLFRMWKFRTYEVNADTKKHREYVQSLIGASGEQADTSEAPMTKLDDAPGIIPMGNLLRKACIDELPQLINVLLGNMSLVGPRPALAYEVEQYVDWHRGRLNALPGMTELWKVSGKNRLTFNQMVRLDIRYAKEQSLWLDIKILLKTPVAVLKQIHDSLSARVCVAS